MIRNLDSQHHRTGVKRLIAAGIAAVLVVAACGSDDDNTAAPGDSASTATNTGETTGDTTGATTPRRPAAAIRRWSSLGAWT